MFMAEVICQSHRKRTGPGIRDSDKLFATLWCGESQLVLLWLVQHRLCAVFSLFSVCALTEVPQ